MYALANLDYLIRRVVDPIYAHTGYDLGQCARAAMYSVLFDEVAALGRDLSVLEISPGGANSPWRALLFRDMWGPITRISIFVTTGSIGDSI